MKERESDNISCSGRVAGLLGARIMGSSILHEIKFYNLSSLFIFAETFILPLITPLYRYKRWDTDLK